MVFVEEEEFLDEYERGDGYTPRPKRREKNSSKSLYLVEYYDRWGDRASFLAEAVSAKQAVHLAAKHAKLRLMEEWERGSQAITVTLVIKE